MKFTFCQISNDLMNPPTGSLAEQFYGAIWDAKHDDGYWKPEYFWELPQWIAEVCHTIPEKHERQLHIVTDVNAELPDSDFYLFSVLDANLPFVQTIIMNNPDKFFVCGGYIELPDNFRDNVTWCHSVKDFAEQFGFTHKGGTDYSLFAGTKCIPRLTLSTGCLHRCRFCTVPDELKERHGDNILQQLESFRDLDFKLIYVDDKTYGQASNYKHLKYMYRYIKGRNNNFEGFIVQTTATKIAELPKTTWKDNHVKVVEIGVETFNDDLLKRYKKPVREYDIARAVLDLNHFGVKVIANIILGLPGETQRTYGYPYSFLR